MKINEVKLVNGEKVKAIYKASEHTEKHEITDNGVKKVFYGYATIETESGKLIFVPTDSKGNVVLRTDIWNFINELPELSDK